MEEFEKESKGKKAVKGIGRIIYNIIVTIITLVIIFEAVIGFVNMQKINNEEEPVWYLDKSEETTTEKGKMTTTLKPFFLK